MTLDGAAPDAGSDATSSCADQRPTPATGVCSSATYECWSVCTTQACVDECVLSDPQPACAACFAQNEAACLVEAGCVESWEAVACCFEMMCAGEPYAAGACPACDASVSAFRICGTELGHAGCAEQVIDCFGADG
jgi:hypothetical protein